MKNHDCDGCFYQYKDHREYPCNGCFMNSRYVHQDVFKDVDDSPVWKRPADALRETFGKKDYDTVNRPRHYMLFEAEGIEVRDVIEKLADKMWAAPMPTKGGAMQYADYVQMMQYLMRFMDKNGVEDLKKARWYLDKMIEAYE
jgi:hypothetical protein